MKQVFKFCRFFWLGCGLVFTSCEKAKIQESETFSTQNKVEHVSCTLQNRTKSVLKECQLILGEQIIRFGSISPPYESTRLGNPLEFFSSQVRGEIHFLKGEEENEVKFDFVLPQNPDSKDYEITIEETSVSVRLRGEK